MIKVDKAKIIEIGIETVEHEAEAIKKLVNSINDDFVGVVEQLVNSKGRLIITGIGKSANIAQKIVATMNSTGTPSVFMHAADAIHGDLGIVQSQDIVICISKSGNTPEIKVLIPLIKARGNTLIAIVADVNSFLAKSSDYLLRIFVDEEACPDNPVPTSSTTAQLVMGDALAVALLSARGFTKDDFARFHPGGSIGKQLYMRVEHIYVNNEVPKVYVDDNIKKIITEITKKRLGATAVLDKSEILVGIITDGDLRRMLEGENVNISEITAGKIMSKNPKTIEKGEMAVKALRVIQNNNISQVIVTKKEKYLGMIHFHDLMREGIV